MKRVGLVIGLLFVAGVLFAAGPSHGTGGAKHALAPSGMYGDGGKGDTDRLREPDRLRDGSCQDAVAMTGTDRLFLFADDRDQLRLHDGSCDGDPLKTHDRDRTGRPDKA